MRKAEAMVVTAFFLCMQKRTVITEEILSEN